MMTLDDRYMQDVGNILKSKRSNACKLDELTFIYLNWRSAVEDDAMPDFPFAPARASL